MSIVHDKCKDRRGWPVNALDSQSAMVKARPSAEERNHAASYADPGQASLSNSLINQNKAITSKKMFHDIHAVEASLIRDC